MPPTASEDLLNMILDRYRHRKSTLITSNRPIEDWGKLLGDNAAASAILDRLLHRGHLLKFEGKSYRLKEASKRLALEKKNNYINLRSANPSVGDFDPATGGGFSSGHPGSYLASEIFHKNHDPPLSFLTNAAKVIFSEPCLFLILSMTLSIRSFLSLFTVSSI